MYQLCIFLQEYFFIYCFNTFPAWQDIDIDIERIFQNVCHMYSSEPWCFSERIAAPQRDGGPSKNKLGHPTEKWRNSLC